MSYKVEQVSVLIPREGFLPDGYYDGLWGGYQIDLTVDNENYRLKTKEGVRGMNIPVLVKVEKGVVTFEKSGG